MKVLPDVFMVLLNETVFTHIYILFVAYIAIYIILWWLAPTMS